MKNNASITGELLSDTHSSTGYLWPEREPDLDKLGDSRMDAAKRNALLLSCSQYDAFDIEDFRTSFGNHSRIERTIAFLSHHAFQFNSKKRFRKSDKVRSVIAAAVTKNAPLDIVIPLFCVIGNWPKRLHPTTLTFAEECTLHSLQLMSELCRAAVGVQLRFQIVSDALFYVRPLGSDPVTSSHYFNAIKDYIDDADLHSLELHDMSMAVADQLVAFDREYSRVLAVLTRDPSAGLSENEHQSWASSMASTITTRDIAADYTNVRATFGDDDYTNPFGVEVLARTERALIDYRALKHALAHLKWDDNRFPGSLRATIHQKRDSILGLRVYPQYKAGSRLLPYHGVAVVTRNDDRTAAMVIEPEINLAGRSSYKRYAMSGGFTDFYVVRR